MPAPKVKKAKAAGKAKKEVGGDLQGTGCGVMFRKRSFALPRVWALVRLRGRGASFGAIWRRGACFALAGWVGNFIIWFSPHF